MDNFFAGIAAKTIFKCDLHTYAHHLWKFEVIPTTTGVSIRDASRLQSFILFNRVEQLFGKAP